MKSLRLNSGNYRPMEATDRYRDRNESNRQRDGKYRKRQNMRIQKNIKKTQVIFAVREQKN